MKQFSYMPAICGFQKATSLIGNPFVGEESNLYFRFINFL